MESILENFRLKEKNKAKELSSITQVKYMKEN